VEAVRSWPRPVSCIECLITTRRHGKFRPTLMKLVSSNDPATAKGTIGDAVTAYRADSNASACSAVESLSKLRGIGPATASLLLAVHDPDHVVFFADEAFYWLCCNGREDPIKYNLKEYQALLTQSRVLCKRLGVRAVDVERVAFVLLHEAHGASTGTSAGKGAKPTKSVPLKASRKRKQTSTSAEKEPLEISATRRSKRSKK